MTPPITTKQFEILNTEFYEFKNLFGRDKLYQILKNKYEDEAPSRRQVAEWLSNQEINQIYHPSKGKAKTIKTKITTPKKILAIDLMNMEKIQVRDYKYLLNGIDMSSRYFYSVALKNKTDKEVYKDWVMNEMNTSPHKDWVMNEMNTSPHGPFNCLDF